MQKLADVKVMDMERLLDEEIERKLFQSEEDYKNGRVRRAEDVFKEWEEKYGICNHFVWA